MVSRAYQYFNEAKLIEKMQTNELVKTIARIKEELAKRNVIKQIENM